MTNNNDDNLISVILPVYNGEKHLIECIESVLNQTYQNFEFIIVDDASTDNTPQILKKFSDKDSRIKVLTHTINQKQTVAANTACQNSSGKYIARMDADDVALPHRFERQVNFLDENPDFGLVGSWSDIINGTGDVIDEWIVETNPAFLKWVFIFEPYFAHATAMMRRETAEKVDFYQSPESEDFDLWSRIGTISKIGCIPEILQQHRIWDGQLNLKVPTETLECVYHIMKRNIESLLQVEISLINVQNIHKVLLNSERLSSVADITNTKNIILDLFTSFLKQNKFTYIDKKLVIRDTVKKLYLLQIWLRNLDPMKSFLLYIKISFMDKRFMIYIILKKILGMNILSKLHN